MNPQRGRTVLLLLLGLLFSFTIVLYLSQFFPKLPNYQAYSLLQSDNAHTSTPALKSEPIEKIDTQFSEDLYYDDIDYPVPENEWVDPHECDPLIKILEEPRTSFSHKSNSVRCYLRDGDGWYAQAVSFQKKRSFKYPHRGFHKAKRFYFCLIQVTPVELDFLGLDRFVPQNRSSDQTEEDAFCERLKTIGAVYRDGTKDKWKFVYQGPDPPPTSANRYCWPRAGGAWVMKLWVDDYDIDYKYFYNNNYTLMNLVGAIGNAFTMEERCIAMERAGAKFCARLDDCAETKQFAGKQIWPEI